MPFEAHRILASRSGRADVVSGDVVRPLPDLIFINDTHVEAIDRKLRSVGVERLNDPTRVVVTTDHEVVYHTAAAAARGSAIRAIIERWGVSRFYDAGEGGQGNVFPVEDGLIGPNTLVAAADVNGVALGASGAVAFNTAFDTYYVLATGSVWWRVPETIGIAVTMNPGRASPRGRDVAFAVLERLRALDVVIEDRAVQVEIVTDANSGTAANTGTSIALCNLLGSAGASIVTMAPLQKLPRHDVTVSVDDQFVQDPTGLITGVDNWEGVDIDMAFVGSCAGGSYHDMVEAAEALEGRRVHPRVRLLIAPASQSTYDRMLNEGLIHQIRSAGAMVLEPGCGACAGGRAGALAAGERAITTMNTNYAGRLGSSDAEILLASAHTVVEAAIAGKVTSGA